MSSRIAASDFVSFSTYLDRTLALFGANRYEHGIGIGWSRAPVRVDAWTQTFDLDALVTSLSAEE